MGGILQAGRRLYYGWYIALALAVTETVSWGIIFYSFSVFLTPMEAEFGWTRTQLTGAFSLGLLVSAAMAYPVGAWIDRHGGRVLMTVGSVLASLLVVAWSQVQTLTMFYLIWVGLGVCFAAVLYDPAFAIVAQWFVRGRGKALALITFAAGLASTLFLPLADALLVFGWRQAVLILGVLLAVVTVPLHLLILRRRPHDLGLLPDGAPQDPQAARGATALISGKTLKEALYNPTFWLLVLAFTLSMLSASGLRVHFIPFLIDIGVHPSTAAFATGIIGFMQVAGRVLFAPLETRLSARALLGGILGLQAFAMALLLVSTGSVWVGVFIVIFGMSQGANTLARPYILAELYGTAHYGRISSVMIIFLTIASTLAPVGAGWFYDRFGSYTPVLWIGVGLAIASTVVVAFLKMHSAPIIEQPAH